MNRPDILFQLPFEGAWLTFWGGDTERQNHHHGNRAQKYAFDFIMVDDDGKFFRTDGTTNDDYYSFGLNVLAPADGEIVEAVNGLRDNLPKEMNDFNVFGNYIMIKHNEDTYSVLCHLKRDSLLVEVGYRVRAGDKIAMCGNSGNTTDPHVHFHVQDSEVIAKVDANYERINVAKGKKAYFSHIVVGGVIKTDYSPVKGDAVSN